MRTTLVGAESVPAHDCAASATLRGVWTGTYTYGLAAVGANDGSVVATLEFPDDGTFWGSGTDSVGAFVVQGDLALATRALDFKKVYVSLAGSGRGGPVWRYRGELDLRGGPSMRGQWGSWTDNPAHFVAQGTFHMTRTPAAASA